MDQKQKFNENRPAVPASLWVGSDESLTIKTIEYLQKKFCPQNGCMVCTTCNQVKTQQHHAIRWFNPEKLYTLEELKPIISTLSFALEQNKHFYFVIQKAHFLTPACANSLLKSIEEPPAGYRFIFLTQQLESILPTIRSRCVTKIWYDSQNSIQHQDLFNCFVQPTNPILFLTVLDKSKINERESIELFDMIFNHWISIYKETLINNEAVEQTQKIITVLQDHAKKLPMPGSSKLFWKNLFLQMHLR